MEQAEVVNAEITGVRYDIERGLSIYIMLNYGGSGQGFGGFMLYAPKGWAAHKHPGNFAGHFIWRVLEIAGVDDPAKLVGQTVRARRTWSKVEAIGHIIKDDWFDPALEFAELKAMFDNPQAEAGPQ